MYKAIRQATLTAARREGANCIRIVHLSIQKTHLHLIVEAPHRTALARGMQSFLISAARLINSALSANAGARQRGTVFADRYHTTLLQTPLQVRNCIAYVLNNWRRHREDRARRVWKIDPYASGPFFDGWKGCLGLVGGFEPPSPTRALIVWRPRTWLLAEGWRRHGRIDAFEVPAGVG